MSKITKIKTNKIFGEWTVLKRGKNTKQNKVTYSCKCNCGTIRDVIATHLISKRSISCGQCESKRFIGKQIGHLKVVSIDDSKTKLYFSKLICECDCGKIIKLTPTQLKEYKSCGCSKNNYTRNRKNKQWTGHKEIPGKLWWSIKNGAKSRNLEFSITIQQAWKLFSEQDGRCALTGRRLWFNSSSAKCDGNASLDRITSNKNIGYVKGNIQWVHKDVNKMKNAYEQDFFIQICKEVAQNNP